MVLMNIFAMSIILSLSVSADALACGYSAGASKLKVPLSGAVAAATVSAAFIAVGMTAGNLSAPFIPEAVGKYISFTLLAVFGLLKLADTGGDSLRADCNQDKRLSVPEGAALGSALSVDGLAAGFANMATAAAIVCTTACTFVFTAAALFFGAKGGRGVKSGRTGNIVAGLALVILAVEKIL
jgi:putative Mn2+ efflux pump MntP